MAYAGKGLEEEQQAVQLCSSRALPSRNPPPPCPALVAALPVPPLLLSLCAATQVCIKGVNGASLALPDLNLPVPQHRQARPRVLAPSPSTAPFTLHFQTLTGQEVPIVVQPRDSFGDVKQKLEVRTRDCGCPRGVCS